MTWTKCDVCEGATESPKKIGQHMVCQGCVSIYNEMRTIVIEAMPPTVDDLMKVIGS